MSIRSLRLAGFACASIFVAISTSVYAQNPAPQVSPAEESCGNGAHNPPSAAREAARQAMRQACAADMAQFCSGVPAKCGERHKCMMAHTAQLSPNCATAMQNLRATR
jgi:hypothetical protein